MPPSCQVPRVRIDKPERSLADGFKSSVGVRIDKPERSLVDGFKSNVGCQLLTLESGICRECDHVQLSDQSRLRFEEQVLALPSSRHAADFDLCAGTANLNF